jgi:hypothetical protein
MPKRTFLQLLPTEPDLRLFAWGDDPRPHRFLDLLYSTWGMLPRPVRPRILDAWRNAPMYLPMMQRSNYFVAAEITNEEKSDFYRGPGGCAAAQYDLFTRKVSYWTPEIYSASEEQGKRTIAHELAHVWQFSFVPDIEDAIQEEAEASVDRILHTWGFPPDDGRIPSRRALLETGAGA